MASAQSWRKAEMMVAAIRIRTMGLLNWLMNNPSGVTRASARMRLGPARSSAARAASELSPSGVEFTLRRTASAGSDQKGLVAMGSLPF